MSTSAPMTAQPAKQRSLSYRLHDALNVPLVGGLSVMCILGLLGFMDARLITKIFITYIVVDGLWIALSPSAVPKHAWAILLHHATLSIRFFWQPYLIYHFRIITHMDSKDRPGGYPFREHYMVMVSQVMLCVFNIMIVLPGLLAKGKRKAKSA